MALTTIVYTILPYGYYGIRCTHNVTVYSYVALKVYIVHDKLASTSLQEF